MFSFEIPSFTLKETDWSEKHTLPSYWRRVIYSVVIVATSFVANANTERKIKNWM